MPSDFVSARTAAIEAAAIYLARAGYQVLDRDWHGEGANLGAHLDLVAVHRNTLVVCRVRPRGIGAVLGSASRKSLRRNGVAWFNVHGVRYDQLRVDLALYYTEAGQTVIEHIPAVG